MKELKFGQMAASMLANGKITRPMEKEFYITQMAIYMKESG